ncbi:vitamin B12-dependent ribonucleotide reductase [Gluconobacter wancherniae]|uniref:TSCPD domain-containing protein n=1 Tax=Gluconobacter wancherniae TaxID=1307955 RepID=UPI0030AEC4FB
MTARLHWTGVRMRTLRVNIDPDDSAMRSVTLPAAWEDDAAQALAQITPTTGGPIRLSSEAGRWVDTIDASPALPGTPADAPSPGRSLSCLLLMRQLAPNVALWQRQPDDAPGFVLRLSGFVQDGGFSPEHFVACMQLACDSLRRLAAETSAERTGELPLFDIPAEQTLDSAGIILLTDLDACLAAQGYDYDSDDGRNAAKAISALATTVARAGTGRAAPSIPNTPLLGLRALAASVMASAENQRLAPIETGFSTPGPVDALLGAEACGLAPVFSPLTEGGQLRESTLARLAHRGLTPEAALAMALGGTAPLPLAGVHAHTAMHQALAGAVDYLPALPEPEMENLRARLERGVRRPLPMRQTGFTQRAAIGGHHIFMRTSEFEDGSLGELSITPARESPMARGLMDCLSQAVSIGLQFGAPLEAFVERFAYTRFGPGGTVEGDPVAAYATSMLDYAFRALSDAYLGTHMPDAPPIEPNAEDPSPMLPFTNTSDERPRGRRLKLVS